MMAADPSGNRALVLVTGMSGAGKSTALKILEDLGYEAIDNLPLSLLSDLVRERDDGSRQGALALGIDSRTRGFDPGDIERYLGPLLGPEGPGDIALLFLDCETEVLRRRFSETRRPHPVAHDQPVEQGIRRERALLGWLRERADLTLDTSRLSVRDLRSVVAARFQPEAAHAPVIFVLSFAYRHGVPSEADFVFDVRFLANPHHVPALRPLTGRAPEVAPTCGTTRPTAPSSREWSRCSAPCCRPSSGTAGPTSPSRLGAPAGATAPSPWRSTWPRRSGAATGRSRCATAISKPRTPRRSGGRPDKLMIGLVLVTHGRLAEEFVAATEHVVGPQARTCAICIGPDDDMEKRRQEILDAIAATDEGDGVIVLTDMFGGTPSNLAISVMESANVEVIAGVNLPMLIKLASVRSSSDLRSAVAAAQEAGRTYIHVAGRLLEGSKT